jgi:CBS domain-containing protein
MEQIADKLENRLGEAVTNAFSAFCEDIGGMFDVSAVCTPLLSGTGKGADLKKDFKKGISINHVDSKGAVHGTFDLMFDQAGTFVVAGIFVMLPEKRILDYVRGGFSGDSSFITDAIKEAGNLLVGSWDRIFRENVEGHGHFLQRGTSVGDPWEKPCEHFSFQPDEDCFYGVCQIKIEPYPEFRCAAVFPLSVLSETPEASEPVLQSAPSEEPAEAMASDTQNASSAEVVPAEIPTPALSNSPATPEHESGRPGPVRQAIEDLTASAVQNTSVVSAAYSSLTAEQLMKTGIIWADPEDTVEQVMKQMQQQGCGYVLVGRDHLIDGLISRSSITAAVSPYLRTVFAQLKRPLDDASLQIRIKWFMSRPVHSIGPKAGVDQVIHTMFKYGIRGLPVVDAQGSVLGFITVYDVLQALVSKGDSVLTGQPPQTLMLF